MQSYLTFSSNYFVLSHFGAKLNHFGQKFDFKEKGYLPWYSWINPTSVKLCTDSKMAVLLLIIMMFGKF